MAERTVTVGPGKDYSNLWDALAAQVALYPNITTDNGSGSAGNLIFKCFAMEENLAGKGAPLAITGWTTSTSYRLYIVGAGEDFVPSENGKWSTNRYRLKGDTNNGVLSLANTTGYVELVDLQIELVINGLTATTKNAIYSQSGNTCYMKRCILRGNISGTNTQEYRGVIAGSVTGVLTMYNCLIYDFYKAGENKGIGILVGYTNSTINAYNCTVYNVWNGYQVNSGTGNWRNCGAAVFSGAGFPSGTQTTCSATTPTFVNAGSRDLHLAGNDVTWTGQGTDYSGTYTTDIDDDTRTVPFSIGCDQYVAGVSPGAIAVNISM